MADQIREALELARAFIAEEADNRAAAGAEASDYEREPRDLLERIDGARNSLADLLARVAELEAGRIVVKGTIEAYPGQTLTFTARSARAEESAVYPEWRPDRDAVARVVLRQQYGASIADSMERRGAVGWLGALEAADAILALSPRPWRPIETAPKDGSYVLVCVEHGDYPLVACSEEDGPRCAREGTTFWPEPTHWLPLPTPPKA